jgi:hypothetical protein
VYFQNLKEIMSFIVALKRQTDADQEGIPTWNVAKTKGILKRMRLPPVLHTNKPMLLVPDQTLNPGRAGNPAHAKSVSSAKTLPPSQTGNPVKPVPPIKKVLPTKAVTPAKAFTPAIAVTPANEDLSGLR